MSIVAAVKEAVKEGLGDYWSLHLPEAQKDAYYKGFAECRRENRDESRDYLIVQAAHRTLRNQGIRGLCFY
jgi:hypothetical protein